MKSGTVGFRKKLDHRGKECFFVGYCIHHSMSTFRVYNPATNLVQESRNVTWLPDLNINKTSQKFDMSMLDQTKVYCSSIHDETMQFDLVNFNPNLSFYGQNPNAVYPKKDAAEQNAIAAEKNASAVPLPGPGSKNKNDAGFKLIPGLTDEKTDTVQTLNSPRMDEEQTDSNLTFTIPNINDLPDENSVPSDDEDDPLQRNKTKVSDTKNKHKSVATRTRSSGYYAPIKLRSNHLVHSCAFVAVLSPPS